MIAIRRLRPKAAALALTSLCAACTGDFDRPRSFLNWGEYQPSIVSRIVQFSGAPFAGLTDDERRLRDAAYGFLVPPDEGGLVQRAIPFDAKYWALMRGHESPIDKTAYAKRLVSIPARSEDMRYARVLDDIRNDMTRMADFVPLSRRVADMDRKRDQSLAFVSGLEPAELDKAKQRIQENGVIIGRVYRAMDQRVVAYRYALERLVISAPSPMAAQVERPLNELTRQIALAQALPLVSQRAAMAVVKD